MKNTLEQQADRLLASRDPQYPAYTEREFARKSRRVLSLDHPTADGQTCLDRLASDPYEDTAAIREQEYGRALNRVTAGDEVKRQAWLLTQEQGLSYRDAADELGVDKSTIVAWIADVRASLRDELRGDDQYHGLAEVIRAEMGRYIKPYFCTRRDPLPDDIQAWRATIEEATNSQTTTDSAGIRFWLTLSPQFIIDDHGTRPAGHEESRYPGERRLPLTVRQLETLATTGTVRLDRSYGGLKITLNPDI